MYISRMYITEKLIIKLSTLGITTEYIYVVDINGYF